MEVLILFLIIMMSIALSVLVPPLGIPLLGISIVLAMSDS